MHSLNATSETLAVHGGAVPTTSLDRANFSSVAGMAGVAGECNASLTKRQMVVMRFVQGCFDTHGRVPSYSEIQAGCGIKSKANVAWHINQLIDRGYLARLSRARHNANIVRRVSVPNIQGVPLYFVPVAHGSDL